jgi:hypothetical protein
VAMRVQMGATDPERTCKTGLLRGRGMQRGVPVADTCEQLSAIDFARGTPLPIISATPGCSRFASFCSSNREGVLPMPKIVATHAVVDVDRWLSGKAERAAAIASWSGSNVADFVAEDGSNKIAVTADIADLESMKALMASPSPEVMATMEKHGVVPPITVYIQA